jgi:DNA-binding HxlR family transcriptional regulator
MATRAHPSPVDLAQVPDRGDCFSADCTARDVFGHVTGRWGGLVLAALLGGTLRFSEVRARIGGISEKMLAQTLREFERDGLVLRRQFPEVPPRVEYELTAAGLEVAQRLDHLIVWIEDHVRDLIAAQQSHEARSGGGPGRRTRAG